MAQAAGRVARGSLQPEIDLLQHEENLPVGLDPPRLDPILVGSVSGYTVEQ